MSSIIFRAVSFGLFLACFGQFRVTRENSRWNNLFFESGHGKLVEPPPADCVYQLVCSQGIVFFRADRLRFVPTKHTGNRVRQADLFPLESVTTRILDVSPFQKWMGRRLKAWAWVPIEIGSANGKTVVAVPNASLAVVQIKLSIETLLASAH